MRFDVVTLFPDMFRGPFEQGVVGQAMKAQQVAFKTWNLRDFTSDKRQSVDDRPFGGGEGMVMMAEPLKQAVVAIRDVGRDDPQAVQNLARTATPDEEVSSRVRQRVIYLSPQGIPFTDQKAKQLVREYDQLILICGRYGGVDQRFINHYVDEEISIGDYVLSGGEIPAMALIDACARQIPGVVGNAQSAEKESFLGNLLEEDVYTQPRVWEDLPVPEVLTGGNHKEIEKFKRAQRIQKTLWRRPDLVYKSDASKEELTEASGRLNVGGRIAVGLVHYPVYNKMGEVVATNVTNYDIHDIARVCRTYGIDNYYIINPMPENLHFVSRVLEHWQQGRGLQYNPSRSDALVNTKVAATLEDALKDWGVQGVKLVATSARKVAGPKPLSYPELRDLSLKEPLFLVFGTGSGLENGFVRGFDYLLDPLRSRAQDGFNHLSVRSAVSIILDRLFGAC